MHERCRGSSRSTAIVLALVSVGCLSSGQTERAHAAPRGTDQLARRSATERWPLFDEILRWPTLTTSPFPSRGHAPAHYQAEVRADPRFATAYRQSVRGTPLPVGLRVAVRHQDPATGAPGPVYLMEKVGEDRWTFAVAGADGTVDSSANLALCARCHADAPNDHVFGLPRDAGAPADSGQE